MIDRQKSARMICRPLRCANLARFRCYSSASAVGLVNEDEFPIPLGFACGGIAAGLKSSGKTDLAMLASKSPCQAAGVFTRNKFKAAPVLVCQDILAAENPNGISSLVINAGQANACTGEKGLEDAWKVSKMAESLSGLPGRALVMSTGIIGHRMDTEKINKGLKILTGDIHESTKGWKQFSRAIMTTDTCPKWSFRKCPRTGIVVGGVSKGSGMIHPNMATMLSVVATDAKINQAALQAALKFSVDQSFNAIDVDGDTSTNDSLVVLANGEKKDSLTVISASDTDPEYCLFKELLTEVCIDLAQKIVRDGEGATKFISIEISGARSDQEATLIAKSIAKSTLFKCAAFGGDPNWGRIICAVGYSGADFLPEDVCLTLSDASNRQVILTHNGQPMQLEDYELQYAEQIMKSNQVNVEVKVGSGLGSAKVWTSDLSYEYVRINAEYTT